MEHFPGKAFDNHLAGKEVGDVYAIENHLHDTIYNSWSV
jgi:hypothetical protein